MIPRSLRLRLLAGAAVWIALALLCSHVALIYLFQANVERSVREDLVATRNRLIAAISSGPDQALLEQTLPDPRYLTPLGGRYWQAENLESGEVMRSRSLWDVELDLTRVPDSADPVFETVTGPDSQRLVAFGGPVTVEGPDNPTVYMVTVAEDRAAIDRSIHQFGFEMTASLTVLGIALLLAAWVQVHLGIRPLGALARAVEGVRAGRSERLGESYPAEVLPLVREVNELLAARDQSLAAARTRAADLAHRLKTPIAVLATTAEKLAARDRETADHLGALAREMSDEVDYQLRVSRIKPRTSTEVLKTSLNTALLRTIAVLRKTRAGETIHWQVSLGPEAWVDVEEHDLLELVGVLLDNAAKWAASRVEVSTLVSDGFVEALIVDDGPGLTADQIAAIGGRGQKLSDEKPGSGFGLAIAKEIVAVNNGGLTFRPADGRGLSVTLRLTKSTLPA